MRSFGFAAVGLSLLAAPAAYAQTSVTQEISSMPVETTITRSPTETIITRRVIEAPIATEQVVTQTTVPRVSRTVTTTARSSTGRARRTVSRTPRAAVAMASPAELRAVSRRTVTRTVTTQAAAPLLLNADQRTVIYRAIADEDTVPAPVSPLASLLPPPPPPPAYPQPVVALPAALGATVVSTPIRTVQRSYLVGSRLPSGVELIALPDDLVAELPSISAYAYATLNGHVLLVDPHTGIIVADLIS